MVSTSVVKQNCLETNSTKPTKVESINDVIKKINKNSERDTDISKRIKTHQVRHWYNNKKLVKVLEKIAGSDFKNDFEALKNELNSADNQKNTSIKSLLNTGDLSILDAIDNLSLERAVGSIGKINHSRENLKTIINLIPENEKTQKEFFKFIKDENFNLTIQPSKNPQYPRAKQLSKTVVKTH